MLRPPGELLPAATCNANAKKGGGGWCSPGSSPPPRAGGAGSWAAVGAPSALLFPPQTQTENISSRKSSHRS